VTRPERTHIPVLDWLAAHKHEPIAVWQIAEATGVSRPRVRYVLRRLQRLGYVARTRRAFAERHWAVTKQWSNDRKVLDDYEWVGALGKMGELL